MELFFEGLPADEDLKKLEISLKGVTTVKPARHRLAELFVLLFREKFLYAPYHLWQGAGKSNWTYHTAFSIQETARTLGLNCIFETLGRLDALVETMNEKPRIVLLAEWESNHRSVFGKDKELEKLWKGLQRKRQAHALLLTHCPLDKYDDFTKNVVEYWQKKAAKRKYFPILFLLVAIYEDSASLPQSLSTIEIFPKEVLLWDGLGFRGAY